MKKLTILIAAAALVCFSVPAMAVDWNFYGNARMATFWTSEDFGDKLNDAGTDDKDSGLQWDLQSNSRIGVNVKADHIRAQVELGLADTAGDDEPVTTRRVWGEWNFGAGKFKVGKDYTPINQFLSGQVARGDAGLLGRGFMYGGRPGQLALEFGGFQVALIANHGQTDDLATGGDIDVSLPKLEAAYDASYDAFSWGVRGGAQTYKIEDISVPTAANPNNTEDIDVTSYVIAADAGFNFGPGYVKGGLSWGRNLGQARWAGGSATFDAAEDEDDTLDVDTLQFGLVAGMKVSDMLSFEIGGGWRQDDPKDAPSTADEKTKSWEIYGQSVILLAPGVYVIPEIGFADFGNDAADLENGKDWYAGAKWQINF